MSDDVVQVIEDAFHRLQQPQPDNPPTDEDLANAARIAVWTCDPALRGQVRASAQGGQVKLEGFVENEAQRAAIEAAVRAMPAGIKGGTNAIRFGSPAAADSGQPAGPMVHRAGGEPMIYITRYCGVDPSSLTAALREALDTLDKRFAELGLPVPEEVVVIYRNRLPESVVLDVGYLLPESAEVETDAEMKRGATPEGLMISTPAQYGSRDLFDVHDRLLRQARLANLLPMALAWQRFPLQAARLRPDHPAAPLYVPVS